VSEYKSSLTSKEEYNDLFEPDFFKLRVQYGNILKRHGRVSRTFPGFFSVTFDQLDTLLVVTCNILSVDSGLQFLSWEFSA